MIRDDIQTRTATQDDVVPISGILIEAAGWMAAHRKPLWRAADLGPDFVQAFVARDEFVVAQVADRIVGVMTLQWCDTLFWPEHDDGLAGYLHKIAVRRDAAGMGVPAAMMAWAARRVVAHGGNCLRLDCDLQPSLCAVYERLGFTKLDTVTVSPVGHGTFTVARYQKSVGST